VYQLVLASFLVILLGMSAYSAHKKVVLATMHQKEQVIAPVLQEQLGWDVWVPDDFDTDQFGTFTREKARRGTQLESARAKAPAAMGRYPEPLGVAGQGGFGAHPQVPLLQRNLELVVLLDDEAGVEVVGAASSTKVVAKSTGVASAEEALQVASEWGFPEQGVIMRRSEQSSRGIAKELRTQEALAAAVSQRLRWPWNKRVTLETDMRAHRCPARQETIAAATRELVARYQQRCPNCQAPGFATATLASTAVCQQCKLPTDVPAEEMITCQVCQYHKVRAIPGVPATVGPGQCVRCNP
jgi:hypothetical protein